MAEPSPTLPLIEELIVQSPEDDNTYSNYTLQGISGGEIDEDRVVVPAAFITIRALVPQDIGLWLNRPSSPQFEVPKLRPYADHFSKFQLNDPRILGRIISPAYQSSVRRHVFDRVRGKDLPLAFIMYSQPSEVGILLPPERSILTFFLLTALEPADMFGEIQRSVISNLRHIKD